MADSYIPISRPQLERILQGIIKRQQQRGGPQGRNSRLVIEDFDGLMGRPAGGQQQMAGPPGVSGEVQQLSQYLYNVGENTAYLNERVEEVAAMMPGPGPGPARRGRRAGSPCHSRLP